MSKSDLLPPCIFSNTNKAECDLDKATLFNMYFHSVFTHSSFNLPSMEDFSTHPNPITTIQQQVLMTSDPKFCRVLHQLWLNRYTTCSLTNHEIPAEWKIHSIVPVYKAGDKTLASNYHPISLLCIISKVLEWLIYNQVFKRISRNISVRQFGFQESKSTLQQLLIYCHDLVSSPDEVDAIYLDFRKAFNCVPHNELLVKLWSIGVTDSLWLWFACYLKDRLQCVLVNGQRSDFLPVISGVLQGSILGPLLFLIYINNLPSAIKFVRAFLFADDTKCYKRIKDTVDILHLQEDINSFFSWSIRDNLLLNLFKCVFMLHHITLTTTHYYLLHPIKTLESSFHLTWSGVVIMSISLPKLLKSLVYSADS